METRLCLAHSLARPQPKLTPGVRALRPVSRQDRLGIMEALAQLKIVAEQQSKERSVNRASKAPPYSHFLRNKTTKLWTTGMRADASLGDVSVMTFCLIEIALTGSRAKLLRNLRYYSAETFDVEKLHHKPARGAGEAPVSLICDTEGPSKIVLSWSPTRRVEPHKRGRNANVSTLTEV